MMKRRLGRMLVALAVAGIGVLGSSSPASASAPTIVFEDICGGVKITVTETSVIQVSRNSVNVGSTPTAVSHWGASPGDVIAVAGFTPAHSYTSPEGCTFPRLEITAEVGCQNIVKLTSNNHGTTPLSGFTWFADGLQSINPFPVGESAQVPAAEDDFTLARGTDPQVIWLRGSVTLPGRCGPTTAHATLTSTCDGKVKIDVTSDIAGLQLVFISLNEAPLDGLDPLQPLMFSLGSPFSKSYSADPGDVFAVLYPVMGSGDPVPGVPAGGIVQIGTHTYAQPDCTSPSPSVSASASESASSTPPPTGNLPVTGVRASVAITGGLLLVAAGAVLYVIARRRRAMAQ